MSRSRLLGGTAVAVLALAGCNSSGGGFVSPDTGLSTALKHVRNTAANRDYVEFGRPAATIAANGGTSLAGAYQRAIGLGTNELFSLGRSLNDATGIDLSTATYAVTAANPPRTGMLASGIDLGSTGGRLESLGATRSAAGSAITYRFRPDGRVDLEDKLAAALPGVITDLNVVQLDGHDLRAGGSAAAIDTTRASGSGLLADKAFRDVATCLGDPLAAELTSRLPVAAKRVRLVGVGISGARGKAPTEQLCLRVASASDAKSLADAVRSAVRTGDSTRTRRPWTELLTGATVSVDGEVVRLEAHPAGGRPGGILLEALRVGDLPGLG